MNKPSITLGADPELFLVDDTGKLRSAVGKFGGTKNSPRPLFWAGQPRAGFYVQEDNVAVEFNIPPAESLVQFMESIEWSVQKLTEEAGYKNLKLQVQASGLFSSDELDTPEAQIFGCDPDFNAWNGGQRNPRPRAKDNTLRSAGGHIHVGYDQKVSRLRMVQAMDLFLGVPSVLMDDDTRRRNLYGRAGSFRPKNYGWEYRVLSNFWIKSKPLIQWAYEQTVRAVEFVTSQDPGTFSLFLEEGNLGKNIQETINESNVNLAQRLCADYDLATV